MNTIGKVTNFAITVDSTYTSITWTDPEDTVVNGLFTDRWTCTKILRKTTGYPTNIADGTVVVSSTVRNQYQVEPFVDSGLNRGTIYYYSAFTIGLHANNICFNHEPSLDRAYVSKYRTMSVSIDFNNSNPETCGTYVDDASSMVYGKTTDAVSAWQEFFGYKPCLFKNGAIVGYLNPNDFTKFEDGTSADITTGNSGDVMIEFPRRGLRLTNNNNVVTVSMTDNPDDSNFKYYAHNRGSTAKDNFYIGVYSSYLSSSKLRSLSGKTISANMTLGNARTYAGNNGSGYMQMSFYQKLYIQAMYCLQFRGNLNSQLTVGAGVTSGSSVPATGTLNTKGMIYGSSSTTERTKLFGIEDLWGSMWQWIDGFRTTSNGNILTATDNFNDTGSGYMDNGVYTSFSSWAYASKVIGTSELGFVLSEQNGSATTYLCDHEQLNKDGVPAGNASSGDGTICGLFSFACGWGASTSIGNLCSRLTYL